MSADLSKSAGASFSAASGRFGPTALTPAPHYRYNRTARRLVRTGLSTPAGLETVQLEEQMHEQPNVLFILSDQHRKHITGCYGDAVVRTPNLDRLASEGVVFENAYCNYPLCAPARMSMLTGREPSTLGMFSNSSMLASDVPTFAHALDIAGYETVLCGRMHFNGPDQRHGFQQRVFPEVSTSGSVVGQLVGTNGFLRTSFEKSGPGKNHYLLYDSQCIAAANRWLADRTAPSGRPFCLVVGLVGPHCPFVCPPEQFDTYFDSVEVPAAAPENGLHPFVRRFRQRSRIDDLTEHEIRRTRAAYYGMIDYDDRLIGTVLDTLKKTGQARNTVVIYASDHGDMAGRHGLWWKMSFYEGSCGIPLIISWPGVIPAGKRETAPVALSSLASTLADIAGAPPIPGATAGSLAALLRGERPEGEISVFSEMIINAEQWKVGPSGGPARMLRKGPWKCNYYHGERPELYNIDEDPLELNDLAADLGNRELIDTMVSEILSDWDPEELRARDVLQHAHLSYMRDAPGDQEVLAGEYWQGPDDYGAVEAV